MISAAKVESRENGLQPWWMTTGWSLGLRLPNVGHSQSLDTTRISDGFGWFRMVLVHAGASPRLCLLLGDGRFQVLEVGAAMDAFQRLHCPCVGQGDAGRKKHSAMSCGHQVYLRRLLAKQGTLQHPCPGYPTYLCYS
jgi:hypothetical protein